MDRPEFITVPVRQRFVRLRPAAICYLQTDGNGMAVIHLANGEVLSTGISPDEVEDAIAGAEPKAAAKPPRARAA